METCKGKPLLMHLMLNCVFFFRCSSNTKRGVVDENGMKSIEKEEKSYSRTIENIKDNEA